MRVCRRVPELRLFVVLASASWGAFSGCGQDASLDNAMGMAGQPAAGMIGGAAGTAPTTQAGAPAGGAGSGMISGAAGSGAAGRTTAMAGTMASAAGAGGAGAGAGTGGTGGSATAGASGAVAAGAGAGGSGGSAANAGAGGMAGSMSAAGGGGMPAMHEDLGKGNGSDVVTIGDSWMNLIVTGIEPSLDKVSGHMYRHYAVPGTLVLNEQIPDQFKQAVSANPMIKTVVMTGGGNDILTSSCSGTDCNSIVDKVADRLGTLLVDMGKAGVADVVIIGYTYPADESKHESLDHSREVSQKTCVPTSMPRCFWVDSSKLDITLQDGIHPNAEIGRAHV